MHISRFDDRHIIDEIITGLLAEGYDLDGLDVQLSLHAPVDLDLLHECLARRLAAAAKAPLPNARAA